MRDLDLKQIRYFIFVANLRSFSKAARVLNITQPALSRHISTLEYDLKAKLLNRSSQGVEPTEAGLKLLEMGEKILAAAEQIRDAVISTAAQPGIAISLGMPPSMSVVIAPVLVEQFARQHPGVSLRIVEGLSVFLEEWLASGKIDIAIMTAPSDSPLLDSEFIAREEMVLVSVRRRKEHVLKFDQVRSLPLLTSHGFRAVIDSYTKPLKISLNYAMLLDSIAILKHMVSRGLGEAIMPYAVVRGEAEAGIFHLTRLTNPTICRDLVVAVAAQKPVQEPVAALRQLVKERISEIEMRPKQVLEQMEDSGSVQ
jgi:LysR family transcriptional regulator, nitrogen assimilation regulatory protein